MRTIITSSKANNTGVTKMKDTMTVTVAMKNGVQAFFKIEFNKSDFFNIVDCLDTELTLESVQNNPLWRIV